MPLVDATVIPKQPLGQDGLADVWLRGNINKLEIFKIEYRGTSDTETVIEKSKYAPGLIRINTDHLPLGTSIELKVEVTSQDSIKHHDWPEGGVYFR